jgi:hypothetical protein
MKKYKKKNNQTMVSIDELIPGKRYIFYAKGSETTYRGQFLEMREIGKKYKYVYILRDCKIKTMTITPFELINKVESLDDILQGKTKLLTDVIGIIDEFL